MAGPKAIKLYVKFFRKTVLAYQSFYREIGCKSAGKKTEKYKLNFYIHAIRLHHKYSKMTIVSYTIQLEIILLRLRWKRKNFVHVHMDKIRFFHNKQCDITLSTSTCLYATENMLYNKIGKYIWVYSVLKAFPEILLLQSERVNMFSHLLYLE